MARRALYLLLLLVTVLVSACGTSAAAAKKSPAPRPAYARDLTWTSANKDGFGTAYTYSDTGWPKMSRVWFTLLNGAPSEVFYPTTEDVAVNRLLVLVGNGHWLDDQQSNMTVVTTLTDPRALAYHVVATSKKHGYSIDESIVTDPARDALLERMTFTGPKADRLYLQLEPSLGSSSAGNSIKTDGSTVTAWKSDAAMTLGTTAHVDLATVGYRTDNDAFTQLKLHHTVRHPYASATNGHVAGALQIAPAGAFTVALGFGTTRAAAAGTEHAALKASFDETQRAYIDGWHGYTSGLSADMGTGTPEFYESAMTVKADEDKTYAGALVASPTHPWGDTVTDTTDQKGYIRVWPRDLYHAAMGLLAAGDTTTPRDILNWMAHAQLLDGSEPQNASLNGTPEWTGTQMDEAAVPVLLAWRLDAVDRYASLVKPAANFIQKNGPSTPQERWEESSGYSPASIAAEIAALVCAADLARKSGDTTSATSWLHTADDWQRKLDGWTFTTDGPLAGHQYYIRISDGNPNSNFLLTIANGGGAWDQRSIVDPSYLEMVRLGVKRPNDPHILATIPVVDTTVGVQTPNGFDWHRYNHDGYGDSATAFGAGSGHLWPVFAGERGNYEVAAGDVSAATTLLTTMQKMAGPTGLIPEQVWEESGVGTHSATPLIWANAEYLVLARSIADRTPFDRPSIVNDRYAQFPFTSLDAHGARNG
jgi:glucoamylase